MSKPSLVAAQMMSHFYSPLHHMYGSLHSPRYPVDQKYPPPALLEQKYSDPKYHQYATSGGGVPSGEDQQELRYPGEKYPDSGSDTKMHCHKPISSPPPPAGQQVAGQYSDRHFLNESAGAELVSEDVKPLDKLQHGDSKVVMQHQLHNNQHHNHHQQDKGSSESSDYESKEGGGYTPEAAGGGGGGGGLYSPEASGYYHQQAGGSSSGADLSTAGGQSPDLSHPTYGGYSTTGAFGLASPLVRPRSNKNKSQAGQSALNLHCWHNLRKIP